MGSIPAPAGETHHVTGRGALRGVHPRACGGNIQAHLAGFLLKGPSPRLRGKLSLTARSRAFFGSIPAPAGETSCGPWKIYDKTVHPRACGGNPGGIEPISAKSGPSPRLRGKHDSHPHRLRPRGSIPAPAGETRKSPSGHRLKWVHPRACGGNGGGGSDGVVDSGPSPRLRGKRDGQGRRRG